jgi:hypothetical protein
MNLAKVSLLAALVLCAALRIGAAQTPSPMPKFSGTEFPVPPAQNQAWQAPATQLDPAVVDGIGKLFGLGLADPRGCQYREIEIDLGEVKKCHGWIIPSTDTQKFAIGWDGLIYPVSTMGKVVDVQHDIHGLLNGDKAWYENMSVNQLDETAPFASAQHAETASCSISKNRSFPGKLSSSEFKPDCCLRHPTPGQLSFAHPFGCPPISQGRCHYRNL